MKTNLEILEFIEDTVNHLAGSISIAESYGQTGTCDHCWLKGEVDALFLVREFILSDEVADAEV